MQRRESNGRQQLLKKMWFKQKLHGIKQKLHSIKQQKEQEQKLDSIEQKLHSIKQKEQEQEQKLHLIKQKEQEQKLHRIEQKEHFLQLYLEEFLEPFMKEQEYDDYSCFENNHTSEIYWDCYHTFRFSEHAVFAPSKKWNFFLM
jgi:hypothetical protein